MSSMLANNPSPELARNMQALTLGTREFGLAYERAQEHRDKFLGLYDAMRNEVAKSVVGLYDPDTEWFKAFEILVMGLADASHTFFIGPPGEGKTRLINAVAFTCGLKTKRVAGNPDMTPADLIGISVDPWNAEGRREFVFRHGPALAEYCFFDEANASSPYAISGVRTILTDHFYYDPWTNFEHQAARPNIHVWAINPAVKGATFELPLAIYDRFSQSVWLGRPTEKILVQILTQRDSLLKPEELTPQFTKEDFAQTRFDLKVLYNSHKHGLVNDYIGRIAMATRTNLHDAREYLVEHSDTREHQLVMRAPYKELMDPFGSSTRANVILANAARVHAYLRGAEEVVEDDVRHVAPDVLRQRILLLPKGENMIAKVDRGIDRFVNHVIENVGRS